MTFKVSKSGGKKLCVRVLRVEHFHSFAMLLATKGIANVLPGEVDDGDLPGATHVYHSMCNRAGVSYRDLASKFGVVAITVEPL